MGGTAVTPSTPLRGTRLVYFSSTEKYTVVCSSPGTQVQIEKAKSLNKEQTTTPQALYKPWCGLF